jgi:hypothetical protein
MYDCMEKHSYHFAHEEDACNAANWLDEHIDDVDLEEFFKDLEAGKRPYIELDDLGAVNPAIKKDSVTSDGTSGQN